MIKLTITKLGTPTTVITKYGPKEKNWLQATEYGAKYLNYWVNPQSKTWQVGQVVEVEGVEERTYPSRKTGKDEISYDIKLPKPQFGGGNNGEVLEAIRQVKHLLETYGPYIKEIHEEIVSKTTEGLEYPENESNEVPF